MTDSGNSGSGSNGNPVGAPPPTPPPAQGPSPLPPPAPAPAPPQPPYTPPAPPAYPPQPPQYGAPPQTPYPAPPQQPPPYQPPTYPQQPPPASYPPPQPQQQQPGYGAPTYAPPYAPPAPQGYQQPMQPGFAPPPAKRGSRTLLIVGIAAVVLIVLLAVGGVLANISLSSTYSAGKAVQAYFAAQARGDANYMTANANFLKGDSGTDAFFNGDAVTAMVGQKENKDVSGVSVSSTEQVDSSTAKVTVAMSWNGNQESQTYTVHKDTSRTHFVFYNDWKLDIPASTISVTLPNQAGAIDVDGIAAPSGTASVSVIQGYHTVTMAKTDFYDSASQSVNAVDGNATVSFPSKLGTAAQAAAVDAIKQAFANTSWCDPAKYLDCPAHKYTVQPGYYDTLPLPGGDVRANSSWIFTYVGDASSTITLSVTTTAGDVSVKGPCAMKLVVDGKTTINFTGDFSGTLSWRTGAFGYDITLNCDATRA